MNGPDRSFTTPQRADKARHVSLGGLARTCCLALVAQLLLVGEPAAQARVFSDGFEDCFPGQKRTWSGAGDGVSWSIPGNWQGAMVPADGDSVSIPVFSPLAVVYDSALGSRTVRCLDSNRALSVTGGSIEILQAAGLNAGLTVTDGAIRVTGRLRVEVP